jgi:hypothetical protein
VKLQFGRQFIELRDKMTRENNVGYGNYECAAEIV